MPKKLPNRVSHAPKKKQSSGTIIYLIVFFIVVFASVLWIQTNTRPQNYAQDITPLLRCDSPCTYNSQCPTGLFCNNGSCRNPMCKDTTDCTCVITPTYNPNAPTFTPRPTPSVTPIKSITPTKTLTPTVTPKVTSTITPSSGIIEITPEAGTPTPEMTVTPTPAVFEVDKENKKASILEVILNFFADIFCKIFGC